jgi:hypothetical protein
MPFGTRIMALSPAVDIAGLPVGDTSAKTG